MQWNSVFDCDTSLQLQPRVSPLFFMNRFRGNSGEGRKEREAMEFSKSILAFWLVKFLFCFVLFLHKGACIVCWTLQRKLRGGNMNSTEAERWLLGCCRLTVLPVSLVASNLHNGNV